MEQASKGEFQSPARRIYSGSCFNIEEHCGRFIVLPHSNLLGLCQEALYLTRLDFSPAQVFLVMKNMPYDGQNYSYEMDNLLCVMRTRLSRPEVQGTDEGNFIHLALGCAKDYWMKPDDTNEGGSLVGASSIMVQVQDIQSVYPGFWKVTARWSFLPGIVVAKQGNLTELAGMFQANDQQTMARTLE